MSTFEDLNDPFELLSARLPKRSLRIALSAFKTDAHGSIGILCFGRSWENPVIWSHYADKHRGMCLGFDILDKYAIPVKYIADRTAVRFLDGVKSNGVDPKYVLDLMRSKYKAWSYENEIRMFVGLDEAEKDSGMFFYPFGSELMLREVILGPRCTVPIFKVRATLANGAASIHVIKTRLAFNSFRVIKIRSQSRIK